MAALNTCDPMLASEPAAISLSPALSPRFRCCHHALLAAFCRASCCVRALFPAAILALVWPRFLPAGDFPLLLSGFENSPNDKLRRLMAWSPTTRLVQALTGPACMFVDAYDTVRYRICPFYWVIVIPPIVAFRDGLLWWDCIPGSLEREAH